jgi:hypothetical protein
MSFFGKIKFNEKACKVPGMLTVFIQSVVDTLPSGIALSADSQAIAFPMTKIISVRPYSEAQATLGVQSIEEKSLCLAKAKYRSEKGALYSMQLYSQKETPIPCPNVFLSMQVVNVQMACF